MYAFLADSLVFVHVLYVGFVVLGQLAIWLGWACGWKWIRNPYFRFIHLAAIGFVAFEAAIDMECPLTVWERQCRELAGQPFSGESFVGRLLHSLIFIRFENPWSYTLLHLSFALVVLLTFVLCPPRRVSGKPLVTAIPANG